MNTEKLIYIFLILLELYSYKVNRSYINKSNKVAIIKNYKNNLCMTYHKKEYKVRLSTCKNNYLKQWIIPKSGEGYYVSKEDTNICLNISKDGSIVTDLCSKNGTKHSNILHSKTGESIWSPLDDTKCLGIPNPIEK